MSEASPKYRKQIVLVGNLIVLVHMLVLLGHGAAHSRLHIEPSPWQRAFIATVIFAAPVLAVLVLWTRKQRAGMGLLGLSLAGSLVFGLYFHFIAAGIDSVFHPAHTRWDAWFRTTAGLLVLVEAAGCAWSIHSYNRLRNTASGGMP